MQRSTQRQDLEDELERLEYKQLKINRKIVRTQVQLELLIRRENRLAFYHDNIEENRYQAARAQRQQTSSGSESSITNENASDDDKNADTEQTDASDSDNDAQETQHTLPNGDPIYKGLKVRILNPTSTGEEEGTVIGATAKRIQIKLADGRTILRNTDNLE